MQTSTPGRGGAAQTGISVGLLREQLGAAYEAFDDRDAERHAGLLNRLAGGDILAMAVEPRDDGRWSLAISCADAVGVLSVIAGLCTAYGLDIEAGDVFTVEAAGAAEAVVRVDARTGRLRRVAEASPGPRRRILDVFEVRCEHADAALWRGFEDDLRGLIGQLASGQGEGARDRVIDRVSEVLRATRSEDAPLAAIESPWSGPRERPRRSSAIQRRCGA